MTSRELLYIKTIADEKSITKAAKRLFLSQPSLSHCVSTIEEQLGAKLFRRTSGGLLLTYAGEQYYRAACEILRIYRDMEEEIGGVNTLARGRVTLGITNYLATSLLPTLLPRFHALYPGVEVDICEENSTEMEQSLLSGRLDLVIMHTCPDTIAARNSALAYETLRRDPFLIVAPPDTPWKEKATPVEGSPYPRLDLRLLRSEPFLLVTKGQRIRQVSDRLFAAAGFAPNVVLTSKNFETLRRLAACGMGCTLIPQQYTTLLGGAEFDTCCFSMPPEMNAYWELAVVTGRDSYLSAAAQALLEQFCLQLDISYPLSPGDTPKNGAL